MKDEKNDDDRIRWTQSEDIHGESGQQEGTKKAKSIKNSVNNIR